MHITTAASGWCCAVVALAAHAMAAEAPSTRPAPLIDAKVIDQQVQERLSADKYPSLSIGIVQDQELVFAKAYGLADRKANRPASPETIYRIGSVSKVFTATLMCILRDKGVVQLDDPAEKYLPKGMHLPTDPRGAPAITLRHLATHTSGLPRMPSNMALGESLAIHGYTQEQLGKALADARLMFPIGARYTYSNLGGGLLGYVLERAAGEPYEDLLGKHLLEPLGMKHTGIHLTPAQQALYATGYGGEDMQTPMPDWDLGCLAGYGEMASSVPDLARFLSLQMRAGQPDVQPVGGGTLREMQTVQRLTDDDWEAGIGLAWHIVRMPEVGEIVMHDGGTNGHFAYVAFLPRKKIGVIVLANAFKEVDSLGMWLLLTAVESLKQAEPTKPLTAEEVLDRYAEALGGQKAFEGIRTLVTYSKGTTVGIPITIEEYLSSPDHYYVKTDMGLLGKSEQGTDGQTVWQVEAGQAKLLTGDAREAVQRAANLLEDVRWRESYRKVESLGVVDFRDRKCYKIVITPHNGAGETRYYDAKDGLLIGAETTMDVPPLGQVPIQTVFEEYRKYGQVLRPGKTTIKTAGMETAVEVLKVEQNVEIPTGRFDPPPAVRAVMARQADSQPSASRPAATRQSATAPAK